MINAATTTIRVKLAAAKQNGKKNNKSNGKLNNDPNEKKLREKDTGPSSE